MNRFGRAFVDTFRAVFRDRAALMTLVGAVVLYSFFYPAAYQHQVASQLPLVVVDQDRSASSRALVRRLQALRAVRVAGVAGSMDEARAAVEQGDAEAVLLVDAGFERDILRGGQGRLALLGNGAMLGRASTVLQGAALAITAEARGLAATQARFAGVPAAPALTLVERPLFNTAEGYGSYVVPGVAVLIVQQTLWLGVVVMAGTRREREGRLRFSRPRLAGIAAAFAVFGLLGLLYFSGFVFWLQDYPRGGNPAGVLLGAALFVAAVVGFAMFVGSFFRTRERAFQLIVVTSLPMFFLSSLPWPVEATPRLLAWGARLLPSTPGINAMVKLNQMGASLAEAAPELANLAVLAVLYGALAVWRYRP